MYCGDETGSFIGEIGSSVSRFGYGGNDCPTYVVPSYVATTFSSSSGSNTNPNHNSTTSIDNIDYRIKKKHRTSHQNKNTTLCIPTTCYNPKWVDPEYCVDFSSPLRNVTAATSRATSSHSSLNSNDHTSSTYHQQQQPILDPDQYLMHGDCIHDWDSYMYLWESAFDTLNVRDSYKHTTGKDRISSSSIVSASGMTSSTIQSTTNSVPMDGKRIHPLLAITPGCSYKVQANNNNDNNQNNPSIQTPTIGGVEISEQIMPNNDDANQMATSTGTSSMHGNNNNNNSTAASIQQHRKELIQLTELFMEQFQCTHGMFVMPAPMVSSFCYGRQTSLIVDVGNKGCCVTPIVDGLVLKQSQRRNGRGNAYLSTVMSYAIEQQLQFQLQQQQQQKQQEEVYNNHSRKQNRLLKARYEVLLSSKQNNNKYKVNRNNTIAADIFHNWAIQDLMYEISTSASTDWNQSLLTKITNNNNNMQPRTLFSPRSETNNNNRHRTSMNDENIFVNTFHHPGISSSSSSSMTYELPDGTILDLSSSSSSSKLHNSSNINVMKAERDDIQMMDTDHDSYRTYHDYPDWGTDICYIPELLFTDTVPFTDITNRTNKNHKSTIVNQHCTLSNQPLHKLIYDSLSSVGDIDVRKELCNSIILVGGTSLLRHPSILMNNNINISTTAGAGATSSILLEQRLSYELSSILSSAYKCKVIASKDNIERTCSSWIGGSIVTSLGSFQQLWLSPAEYEEYGAALAIQRFP